MCPIVRSRHGHDHMVVVFTTTFVPLQSLPITTNVESSNPAQARCTRYNIISQLFSLGTPVSYTNKTEILLKVALNTINQTKSSIVCDERWLLVLLTVVKLFFNFFFHKEENRIHVSRFVTSLCVICFINFSFFILSLKVER